MRKIGPKQLGQALALGLSAAMMSALALVGAAPAVAENAPGYYSVLGSVVSADGAPLAGVEASVSFTEEGSSPSRYAVVTDVDGLFTIEGFPAGDYVLDLALEGYADQAVSFSVVDADVTLDADVTMTPVLEELTAGTVAISGTPVVGNVLTAVTDGWPAGATLTYDWGYSGGNWGDSTGETGETFTMTKDLIGTWMMVIVTGTLDGFSPTTASAFLETATSAPKQAAAPAPTDLTAYLLANGSTPQAQTSTGLPAGALNPGTAQTANLGWTSPDSFVDVYVFSSPVFLGTFAVVNGVVQIPLSTTVLAQLAAGNHTLVATGQSSGVVQSVALSIGLPVTGVDVTVPITVATLLVLLGASLIFVRRRFGARV